MPKLLDFIKEKGLSHDDVIKMLEESADSEDSDEEEEEEEEDSQEDEEVEEEEDTEIDDNTDAPKTFTLKDVEKMITKALENTKKAKRKSPSKGNKKGTGTPKKPIYTREDMFEEMF